MTSTRTIAKNTLYLYVRMFFNMGVSLFTSRVILNTLGVNDYGIYNLVAGIVVLFSFLNSAMSSSTQRFLNYEIAKKNIEKVNKVFCTSFNIHVLISIVVLLLGETVGLWFLNYKLNIPTNRIYAANWVYQMSLFTTVINITRIPYNSVIIAYQQMSFYAYVGVLETILKLLIVYMLVLFSNIDHLIAYAALLLMVNVLMNIIYRYYCIKKYKKESSYHFRRETELMKEMTNFSGWNLLGQIANVGSTQGLAMVLNIFIGVTINAAMGIANQINAAIYSFISNFQIAFNPQITQTYARGEYESHSKLLLTTSKMSFFLLAFIAFPVLVNTNFILNLWLGNTLPEYVDQFTQIIILISLIDALSGSFWMSAHAIGNIKKYQIYLSILLLFNVPIAYVLLSQQVSPTYVLISKLVLNFLAFVFRFWYVKSALKLTSQHAFDFLFAVFVSFFVIVVITNYSYYIFMDNMYLNFIFKSILSEFILLSLLLVIGLNSAEKRQVINLIKNRFHI